MSSTPLFIRYSGVGGGGGTGPQGATGTKGATGSQGEQGLSGGAGLFIWLNLWDTVPPPLNPLSSSGPYLAEVNASINTSSNPAIISLPNGLSGGNSLTFQLVAGNTFKLTGGGQWHLTLYGFSNTSSVYFSVTNIQNITSGHFLLGGYSEITELSTMVGKTINVTNGNIAPNFWQINQNDQIEITITFYGDSNASIVPPTSQLFLYFRFE